MFNLLALPRDLWNYIAFTLCLRDLALLKRSCKSINAQLSNSNFWKSYTRSSFGEDSVPDGLAVEEYQHMCVTLVAWYRMDEWCKNIVFKPGHISWGFPDLPIFKEPRIPVKDFLFNTNYTDHTRKRVFSHLLHKSAVNKSSYAASLLLDLAVNLFGRFYSPFISNNAPFAAISQSPLVLKIFLDKGLGVNFSSGYLLQPEQRNFQRTLINYAVSQGKEESLQLLLSRKAPVGKAIMVALCSNAPQKILDIITEHTELENLCDAFCWILDKDLKYDTGKIWEKVVAIPSQKIVNALVKRGDLEKLKKINDINIDETLYFAVENDQKSIVEYILTLKGAKTNNQECVEAVKSVEMAKLLVDALKLTKRDLNAIAWKMSLRKSYELLAFFLERGADPDYCPNGDSSMLAHCAYSRDRTAMKILIDHGASSVEGLRGRTKTSVEELIKRSKESLQTKTICKGKKANGENCSRLVNGNYCWQHKQ